MKRISLKHCFVFFTLVAFESFACVQDPSSNDAGSLSLSNVYQTVNVSVGDYFSFELMQCEQVTFTFCNNGGTAGFDTQISILNAAGDTELAYNDDNCGLQSELSFTATTSGTYKVLITKFNCNHTSGETGTMAFLRSTQTVGDYTINQDSSPLNVGGENCVQLTTEADFQRGCVWNRNSINFNNPIDLEVTYYFGDNGANGADGNTFVFKPSDDQCVCGTSGYEIGAGGGGIPNAVIIEFDTYDNDGVDNDDLANDHIAVEIDGFLILNAASPAPFCGPVDAIAGGAEIDDGVEHDVRITWDPVTQDLSVFFDGNLRLTCNHDFITNVFGGVTDITWGVTSSTGALNNQQYFCPSTVVLPVELSSFEANCIDDKAILNWKSLNESNFLRYEIQRTYDGIAFETVGVVDAKGQGEDYEFQTSLKNKTNTYFRLKMVDIDGKEEYSDFVTTKCEAENELEVKYINDNGQVFLEMNSGQSGEYALEIISLFGKVLRREQLTHNGNFSNHLVSKQNLSGEFYLIRLTKNNEHISANKVFLK